LLRFVKIPDNFFVSQNFRNDVEDCLVQLGLLSDTTTLCVIPTQVGIYFIYCKMVWIEAGAEVVAREIPDNFFMPQKFQEWRWRLFDAIGFVKWFNYNLCVIPLPLSSFLNPYRHSCEGRNL